MLACVYHPLGTMRVVEDEEAEELIATGVWFNSPKTARESKEAIAKEIAQEATLKANDKPKGTRK
jgi:hypothetical protein